jgi:hypothetical protein
MSRFDDVSLRWGAIHGVAMTGLWSELGWWLHSNPHASAAGSATLLLVAFVYSLVALLYVFRVIFKTIRSPILLYHSLYDALLWALSPWFVLAVQKSREPPSRCDQCRLCENCDSLIEDSPLLVGANSIFIRAKESHTFYNEKQLRISSQNSHLCNLLRHSAAGSNLASLPGTKLSYGKTPQEDTSEVSN